MANIYFIAQGGNTFVNAAAVSSILKEGTIISTKLFPGNAWHHNIVYSIQNSTVQILLLDSYIQNLIALGSNITLKHANEYFEYLFDGTVIAVKPGYPGFVKVSVNKAEELINTRVFPRYDIYLAASVRPVWSDEPYFAILTNISLGGAAFVSKREFEYGDECEITLYLPHQRMISAKGKIIRRLIKGEIFNYSIQFIEMVEYDSNLLLDYITELEEEWARMRYDYDENVKKTDF